MFLCCLLLILFCVGLILLNSSLLCYGCFVIAITCFGVYVIVCLLGVGVLVGYL